jgi:hypothetical protein
MVCFGTRVSVNLIGYNVRNHQYQPKVEIMSDEMENVEDRRAFLERAGKTAMAAPAVALLLSAAGRQAMAGQYSSHHPMPMPPPPPKPPHRP